MSDPVPESKDGFLMLSRRFFAHGFWEESRTYSRAEAWIDLVQMAAFTDKKVVINSNLMAVPRGAIVASVRFLESRWNWSNTKVCKFLEVLRANGMITTEKRQGISIILLCKYEAYNTPETTRKRQKNDSEATPERRGNDTETTEGRQRDDEIEECKEGEEGKECKNSSDASTKPAKPFWSLQTGWANITDEMKAKMSAAFPACDIETELLRAAEWLESNPTKAKKSNWRKFLNNWLTNSQDRGGTRGIIHRQPELIGTFPSTQQEAIAQMNGTEIPHGFIISLWSQAAARGGRDGAGISISQWQHFVRHRWDREIAEQPDQRQTPPKNKGPNI